MLKVEYRLKNTVMTSFNTTVRQTTEMLQWTKCLNKYDRNVSVKKNPYGNWQCFSFDHTAFAKITYYRCSCRNNYLNPCAQLFQQAFFSTDIWIFASSVTILYLSCCPYPKKSNCHANQTLKCRCGKNTFSGVVDNESIVPLNLIALMLIESFNCKTIFNAITAWSRLTLFKLQGWIFSFLDWCFNFIMNIHVLSLHFSFKITSSSILWSTASIESQVFFHLLHQCCSSKRNTYHCQ